MKKIFLTIVVLFTVMFNGFGQQIKSNEHHNIKLSIPVGDKYHFDTIVSFETMGYCEMHKFIDFTLVQKTIDGKKVNTTIIKDITYQPINNTENLKQLNHGVNTFAKLEIASLCVGVISGVTTLVLVTTDHNIGAATVGIGGGLAALGLHVAALVILKNNSLDNFYISDKGVGFKIDIK